MVRPPRIRPDDTFKPFVTTWRTVNANPHVELRAILRCRSGARFPLLSATECHRVMWFAQLGRNGRSAQYCQSEEASGCEPATLDAIIFAERRSNRSFRRGDDTFR